MKVETYWKRGYGQELFLTGHFTEVEVKELKKEGYRKFFPNRTRQSNKTNKPRWKKKVESKKAVMTNKNGIQIDSRRAM